MEGCKTEYLGSGISVIVSKEHTFGTDAVLLADFSSPASKSVCCDLGTGCGIIPMLWVKKKVSEITAVDIQEKAIEQLKESIKVNNLEDTITPINADLKQLKGKVPFGYFNLVTMNPPYTAEGSGIISRETSDKIARHGIMCSFADICKSASSLLNFGGRFCICIRPERIAEMFREMSCNSIEPKRIRFVAKRIGCKPWLVLIEGKRGGKTGLVVEPELYVYNDNNTYSDEMKNIYGDYFLENRGEKN